jgi:hypothetical protein
MTKQLWINLPVKDVAMSKSFYTALGFQANQHFNDPQGASFFVGEQKVVLMLFDESRFEAYAQAPAAWSGAEMLISVDAESKEEVDEMAARAGAAGGWTDHQPQEMKGWMYGCLIRDPDGHRWNVLYMDSSRMAG